MKTIKAYTIEELSHGSYLNAIESQREFLIESNGINEFLEDPVYELLYEAIAEIQGLNKDVSITQKFNYIGRSINKTFPKWAWDGSDFGFTFGSKNLSKELLEVEESIGNEVIELYKSYLDDQNVYFTIDPQEKQFDFDGNIIY